MTTAAIPTLDATTLFDIVPVTFAEPTPRRAARPAPSAPAMFGITRAAAGVADRVVSSLAAVMGSAFAMGVSYQIATMW